MKKKLKIFAVVGVIGFIITSTLLLWAGVSAFRFANDQIKNVNLQSLPTVTALSCWNKAQNLLTVEAWLAKPAIDNLNSLKTACLELKPSLCEGANCQDLKIPTNKESEQII